MNLKLLKCSKARGACVAQCVKCQTSAQVMISRFVSWSPASPASDSVSPSLCPSPACVLSLSQRINKYFLKFSLSQRMNIFFKKGLRQEVRSITFPESSFPPNDPNWKHELRQRESALQDYASVTLKEFYSLFLYYMFILIYIYILISIIFQLYFIFIYPLSPEYWKELFISLFFSFYNTLIVIYYQLP